MFGAFLASAIGAGDPAVKTSRHVLQAFYHLGRLITYISLGVFAGTLGATLDLGGSLVGLQRTAAIVAGAMMVTFGLLTLLRVLGANIRRMPIPAVLTKFASAGHARAAHLTPSARALVTGLLTTLLPCGWLYAFVITAAGTASPGLGALTMFAFWLGTLPVLATLGFSFHKVSRALGAQLPAITASAIILVGIYTIYSRTSRAAEIAQHTHAPTTQRTLEQIQHLPAETLPCCVTPSTQEAAK